MKYQEDIRAISLVAITNSVQLIDQERMSVVVFEMTLRYIYISSERPDQIWHDDYEQYARAS